MSSQTSSADNVAVIPLESRTLYVRRWFIVIAVALLNTSNAITWNSFATVAATTGEYYGVGFDAVNMLSIVYMIISIPVGILAIWALDSLGLRTSLTVSAVLNAIGAAVRLLTVFDFIEKEGSTKYYVLLVGQCIAAASQAPIMFCPPKVAQYWFPDNQRAIANTIASMANPLGILLAAVLSPQILMGKTENMQTLMIAYTCPAVFAMFFTLLSLTSSRPTTPPSESAEQQSEPFLQGAKLVIKNKMFLLLMVCFGTGMAIFTALTALILQILCPYGYDETYSGTVTGVMVGSGIVGAAITGIIADTTKKFVEVSKVSLSMAVTFFCLFTIVVLYPGQDILLAVVMGLFGFFGFGQYAICLELAVETTFPVAEATSAGLMVITGQIQSAIVVLVMQPLAFPVSYPYSKCNPEDTGTADTLSYIYGNILLSAMGFLAGSALVCFYQCPYKRQAFEKQAQQQQQRQQQSQATNAGSHYYQGVNNAAQPVA